MPEPIGITKDELKSLRDQGLTVKQIAERYGCCDRLVNKYIKRFGLIKNTFHELDTNEMVRLYEEEGMTVQQIADAFGVYYNVVWTRITNVAKMRPRARRFGTYVGRDNANWLGGVHVTENGYIRIRLGPNFERPLHRILAEQMLERPLTDEEVVHHMDENPGNNALSNLLVCENTCEHMRLHAAMRRNPGLDQRKWLEEYRANQREKMQPQPVLSN